MPTRRTVRVAEVLRRELSTCLAQCLELEDLLITIVSIEIPPDMKHAYVYVSTLNPEIEREDALARLTRQRRNWQGTIGRRMGIKFTPQLVFRFDESVERGDKVMEILTELNLASGKPGEIPEHEMEDPHHDPHDVEKEEEED